MMKKLLLAGIAFAAVAGPATAADLARPSVAVAAPIYTWTGFYVGGNVGGAWENTKTNYSYISTRAPNLPGSRTFSDRAVR
jgi:outer membrane immunogenic protein